MNTVTKIEKLNADQCAITWPSDCDYKHTLRGWMLHLPYIQSGEVNGKLYQCIFPADRLEEVERIREEVEECAKSKILHKSGIGEYHLYRDWDQRRVIRGGDMEETANQVYHIYRKPPTGWRNVLVGSLEFVPEYFESGRWVFCCARHGMHLIGTEGYTYKQAIADSLAIIERNRDNAVSH